MIPFKYKHIKLMCQDTKTNDFGRRKNKGRLSIGICLQNYVMKTIANGTKQRWQIFTKQSHPHSLF